MFVVFKWVRHIGNDVPPHAFQIFGYNLDFGPALQGLPGAIALYSVWWGLPGLARSTRVAGWLAMLQTAERWGGNGSWPAWVPSVHLNAGGVNFSGGTGLGDQGVRGAPK